MYQEGFAFDPKYVYWVIQYLEYEPELVPEPLLPHPGGQEELPLQQTVNDLE